MLLQSRTICQRTRQVVLKFRKIHIEAFTKCFKNLFLTYLILLFILEKAFFIHSIKNPDKIKFHTLLNIQVNSTFFTTTFCITGLRIFTLKWIYYSFDFSDTMVCRIIRRTKGVK